MDEIWSEVFRAVGLLIGVGLILLAYNLAKDFTRDSDKGLYMSLLIGLAICGVIGFVNASNVGKPSCIDSESDGTRTTCLEYDDDGYTPSIEEQISVFAYWFIITMVPVGFGVNAGIREKEKKQSKS